ncbi:MAG: septum formation inhibitor Maf [Clostridia bacterium]|nr:septum formation inhibitor Maf [Clostridia bacterium]
MDIILASGSPRRRQLLAQMGLEDFTVHSSDVDETVDQSLPPSKIVEELSLRKAGAVAEELGGRGLILAADTIVTIEGTVLGKPRDENDAFCMLTRLSGCRHQVYTGVTLLHEGRVLTEHEVTDVTFRELTGEEIADYIATGEPGDKAGAYGIQGCGALLVERIEGDYFNVMGLPVCRVGRMLEQFGVHPMKLAAKR